MRHICRRLGDNDQVLACSCEAPSLNRVVKARNLSLLYLLERIHDGAEQIGLLRAKESVSVSIAAIDLRHFARKYASTVGLALIAATLFVNGLHILQTSAATSALVPNSNVTSGWPTVVGSSGCAGACGAVNEGATPDTSSYIATDQTNNPRVQEFGMTTASNIEEATSITVRVHANTVAVGSDNDTLTLNARINGTLQGAQTYTPSAGSWGWLEATYTGSWSQADIDSLQVQLTRNVVGGGQPAGRADEIRVSTVYTELEYTVSALAEQSSYRWFENEDASSGWELEGTLFPVRRDHAATVLNGELYIIAGNNGASVGSTAYNDVWASSDGVNWEAKTNDAPFPTRFSHATTTFDNKLWISGGRENTSVGNELSDVWYSDDGEQWVEATSSAPWGPRNGHTMLTFDNKMWIIGGHDYAEGHFNDVWSSTDGVNWTEETASAGWPARRLHSSTVFDGKMWVTGGMYNDNGAQRLNDVWSSTDGVNWTEETASADWIARNAHEIIAYDGKLWLAGGNASINDSTTYLDDVWSSTDGANWTEETSSAQWQERSTFVMSVINNEMWIHGGGRFAGQVSLDGWASSDGSEWTQKMWTVRRVRGSATTFDDKMWVLGGFNGVVDNDVWTITETNGKASWELVTDSAGWSGRLGHESIVFDEKLWIVGGDDNSGTYFDDVWSTTDGVNWSEEIASAPWDSRSGFGLVVYDDRLWIFGGYDGSNYRNDVWSSADGVNWTEETASAPWNARSRHTSLTFDNKMWVIGGTDGSRYNDVWSSTDGVNWTEETTSAGWVGRDSHTSTVYKDKMWVIGGYDGSNDNNDAWSSADGVTWQQETANGPWNVRSYHASTMYNDKIWLTGGFDNGSYLGSTWSYTAPAELEPLADQNTSATAPAEGEPFRLRATLSIDQGDIAPESLDLKLQYADVGPSGVCSSDFSGEEYHDITGPQLQEWEQATASAAWDNRGDHVSFAFDDKLWVMGGYDGVTRYGDVWSSSDGENWTEELTSAPWGARSGHAGFVHDGKMWIIGGFDGSTYRNDVWTSEDGENWTEVTSNAGWSGRNAHTAVVYDGKLWIMGGWDGSAANNDVWTSEDGENWTEATANADWANRTRHATVAFDDALWTMGGGEGTTRYNDVWRSTDGENWTEESTTAEWSGRINHNVVVFNGQMWLSGGFIGGADAQEVWTSSDGENWTEESTPPWSGRIHHRKVILDDELWLIGGSTSGSYLSDVWSVGVDVPPIDFYDNSQISDGSGIGSLAEDPSPGFGDAYYQSYVESNNFTNPNAIPAGDYGVWDFALVDTGAPAETTYCFRIVYGGGGEMDAYTVVPELHIPPPSYTQDSYRWFENADNATYATFAQTWGGSGDDRGQSITSTSDGGFAVTGFTESYGNGTSGLADMFLAKYSPGGDLEWSRTWGGSGDDIGWDVIEMDNGDLAVTGVTTSYGAGSDAMFLARYSQNGSLSWSRTWGGGGAESGEGVVETADGGLAVVGWSTGSGFANSSTNAFLVKYDSSGDVEWSRAFGGDSGIEYGLNVVVTTGGNLVVVGQTENYGDGSDAMYIASYDSSGNNVWFNSWSGSGIDAGYDLAATSDGGVVVTGRTTSYGAGSEAMFLVKYDSSGEMDWSRTWGGSGIDSGLGVIHTSDGGYAVTGRTTSFGAGNEDVFLAKYDPDGTYEWSHTFGGTSADFGSSITETSDGGYAVTGRTMSFGAGSYDMLLLKYDPEGNINGCAARCTTPGASTDTPAPNTATHSPDSVGVSASTDSPIADESSPEVAVEVIVSGGVYLKTAGDTGNEYYYSVVETSDGGTLAVGRSNSFGSGSFDGLLTKYDFTGEIEWSRTLGDTGVERFDEAIELSGGDLLTVGSTTSFGAGSDDLFIARYEPDGSLVWARTHGDTEADWVEDIVEAGDGTLYAAGSTHSNGSGSPEGLVAAIDAINGDLQWVKSYGGAGDDQLFSIDVLTDGSLIAVGTTTSGGPGNRAGLVINLTESGSINWVRGYGGSDNEYFNSVTALAGGGFAIAGDTRSYGTNNEGILTARFDAEGEVEWSEVVSGAGFDVGWSIDEAKGGRLVIGGQTSSYGNGSDEAFVAEYSLAGELLWIRTFGDNNIDQYHGITSMSSGAIAAVGTSRYDETFVYNGVVAKYGLEGEMPGCGSLCTSPIVDEFSPTLDTTSVSVGSTDMSFSSTSPATSISSPTLNENVIVAFTHTDFYRPIGVGGALSDINTAATLSGPNQNVRLRLLLDVDDKDASHGNFKLQYAPRLSETCTADFAGYEYQDILGQGQGAMTFHDNESATHGIAFGASDEDPYNGREVIRQMYVENNSFSLINETPSGGTAMWDVSIYDNSDLGGSYCFRVVREDGSLLSSYTQIAELSTPPRTSQQLRHGRWFDISELARPFYW